MRGRRSWGPVRFTGDGSKRDEYGRWLTGRTSTALAVWEWPISALITARETECNDGSPQAAAGQNRRIRNIDVTQSRLQARSLRVTWTLRTSDIPIALKDIYFSGLRGFFYAKPRPLENLQYKTRITVRRPPSKTSFEIRQVKML
jgi:hypothetical protein